MKLGDKALERDSGHSVISRPFVPKNSDTLTGLTIEEFEQMKLVLLEKVN